MAKPELREIAESINQMQDAGCSTIYATLLNRVVELEGRVIYHEYSGEYAWSALSDSDRQYWKGEAIKKLDLEGVWKVDGLE